MDTATVRPEWLFEVANRAQALALTSCSFAAAADLCQQLGLPQPVSPAEERILHRFFGERSVGIPLERIVGQQVAHAEKGFRTSPRDTRISEAVERAVHLLRTEHARRWTLMSLSRRIGCNRTDLEAAFKARFGRTVHGYLTGCRVDAAKVLLRTTHWRMLEIARAVGYRTKASLCRAFDQTLGMTPEQYRTGWRPVPANKHVAELLNLNRDCQI